MKKILRKIFKPSERRWVLPLLSVIYVVLIPLLTTATVVINQQMGAYSATSDTLIIPVVQSVTVAMVFAAYLIILNAAVLIKFQKEQDILSVKSKVWLTAGIIMAIPGILVCILMILYWLSINHLPLVIVYLFGIYVVLRLMFPIMNKGGICRRDK